jgi:glycolate oxidase
VPHDLVGDLARVVPASRLVTAAGALAAYESDGLTAFRARPRAVVLAETVEDVVATVQWCHRAGVPFVARGSGTSLSGGAVPDADGIVIALNRLNRILELDPVDRVAVVEPGVFNLDVSVAAMPHDLYYAPDPSSQSVCTIGGNVAYNSGGAHCFRYGMTLNHVLGLKAVLPDGEIVSLGGRSLEGVGPDLVGGYVGSEGLFGIALEITLRLLPRPGAYRTVLAAYHSLAAAGDTVSRIVAAGLLPGAMEIMDRLAIEAAEAAVHAGYPLDAAAILLVELEGEQAAVDADAVPLDALIADSGAYEVRVARDADERAAFWKGRKSTFSAVGRLSPDFLVQDGVVPRSRLGEALEQIEVLSRKYSLRVANVFHAGDGNLHPLILFDINKPGEMEKAERAGEEILKLCVEVGGCLTGEHGVGIEKRDLMRCQFTEADLRQQMRVRGVFDPGWLMNPAKVFPLEGRVAV